MNNKLLPTAIALALALNTQAQDICSGMISQYRFNNSLNNENGAEPFSNASTNFNPGKVAQGLIVVNDLRSASISNLPVGNAVRTVAFWIYRGVGTNVSQSPNIFRYGSLSAGQTFGCYFSTAGTLVFQGYGGGNDHDFGSSAAIPQGTWQHIAIQTNGTSVSAYVNGVSVGSFTPSSPINTTSSAFVFGSIYTGIVVDDLRIYDRALSSTDITELYNNPERTCCSALTGIAIPDANFKNYLVGNSLINTNLDGEIQCTEALAFTGTIECPSLNIADLTGIEAFVNLTKLDCKSNQLNNLDLSANIALTEFDCSYNSIANLDLSANTALSKLVCDGNQLTNLDLSTNTALIHLICGGNQLTNLDLSANTALYTLICAENSLTSLNLSANTLLYELNCCYNGLTSLNLSTNTALNYVVCNNNQLTQLDLSAQVGLATLYCQDNPLTALNIANGNNGNLYLFWAYNTPNLDCIQVDDAVASSNWTNGTAPNDPFVYDAGVSFSENCVNTGIFAPDAAHAIRLYPNPAQQMLTLELNEAGIVQIVNILGEVLRSEWLQAGTNNLNINELNSGVYFIKTEKGGSVKFVKS